MIYKLGFSLNQQQYKLDLENKRKRYNYEYAKKSFLFYKYNKELRFEKISSEEKQFIDQLRYHFKDSYKFRNETWLRRLFFESDQVMTYKMTQKINEYICDSK